MDANRPVSSTMESSTAVVQPHVLTESIPNGFTATAGTQESESMVGTEESSIGYLDVYIHHAREIQNICIYHKQDVYAKVCLTADPETSFSTQIINGGGRNPVFNENIRLDVRTIETSLKCEIWMLSRVKNYLKDQLLGFTLVPLLDVIAKNGQVTEGEFSLSATDLFDSPSGFVRLSLSYVGSAPDVVAVAARAPPAIVDTALPDLEETGSVPSEYVKIEFPDLNVVDENQMMVSEYFGIPCDNLESKCSTGLAPLDNDDFPDSDAGVRIVESFSSGNVDTREVLKHDSPQSEISVNGSPAQSLSDPSGITESSNLNHKGTESGGSEVDSANGKPPSAFAPPLININIEPEQTVVQQEIVDLYMKSMQQFTESLAKMKLPMDIETNGSDSKKASSDTEQKPQASKGNGPRVFYGSRAFF